MKNIGIILEELSNGEAVPLESLLLAQAYIDDCVEKATAHSNSAGRGLKPNGGRVFNHSNFGMLDDYWTDANSSHSTNETPFTNGSPLGPLSYMG